ncbi:unnamed protein product [Spirodela intermedia]|uniref:Two-component response regulator n=1 Tax=Spirodela intermedia TaxID=51605 RepID=A0A7I8IVK5_SPIIN|nr:unnamed protein product [Spirodela intermedia]CAA6661662.1 unnamed protein product [Spirodela intermedia]
MDPVPKDSAPRDQFPVGMRVLAVDDDPTCLRLLDSLLRRCQYHVTTTNQAITALKLLRENKDKFDLVISDVHMPDMDGFKLLELVGLEMDLPVIMLSANSDTKAVMKGIAHGACDYLLKPVRIEELRNIWQHVIRRKKFDRKDLCDRDNGDAREKPNHVGSDGRQGPGSEASDSNGRFNRKRKDQNEEDDDSEDNGNDNDDPSSQKKPRVVWSVDLHRKFVAAVNELGIDKAVPKRILELMNVERLTRENVASHLQKFRLYLKRIHAVTSQQSNIFAALGGKESYVAMSPIDGMGSFNAAARPRQLPTLTSFQSSGSAGRLNSLSGIGLHGLSSSGMIQLGHSNSIQDVGKIPRTNLPGGIHQGSLLNRMPTAVEVNQFQQLKAANEASNQLLGVMPNLPRSVALAACSLTPQVAILSYNNSSRVRRVSGRLSEQRHCNPTLFRNCQIWADAAMSGTIPLRYRSTLLVICHRVVLLGTEIYLLCGASREAVLLWLHQVTAPSLMLLTAVWRPTALL